MTPDDPLATDLYSAIADGRPPSGDALCEAGLDESHRAGLLLLADVARAFRTGVQPAPARATLQFRWGPLEVHEELGRGSGAVVHRAFDPWLEREVALKLFAPGEPAVRALEEARLLARLRHPHLLLVHGCAVHDGRAGIWSERLHGQSLAAALDAGGAFSALEALRVAHDLADALAAVHAAGLVHGDVKPANVMRETGGRVVLVDFGSSGEREQLAQRLHLVATPRYLAPEVIDGAAPSAASDGYALGALLWELLAGRAPFDAATLAALREQQRHAPQLARRRPGLSPALAARVDALVDPDPVRRPSDARALARELQVMLAQIVPARATPTHAHADPRRRLIVTLALLAAVGPALWLAGGPLPASLGAQLDFVRIDAQGEHALPAGSELALGDRLRLRLRSARPAWVYVLNQDAQGLATLLHPLARDANPVAPRGEAVLPGGDAELAWQISAPAPYEEFLVIAAPQPLPEIERELDAWQRVTDARGAGRLVPADDAPILSGEKLKTLLGRLERDPKRQVQVWIRRYPHRGEGGR
jgi:hypothetical protein